MRLNVPTAFIAIFAACFAIVGTLVLPKVQAGENDKKAIQNFNPRVQVPAVTAPATHSVYGQDGKTQPATANSKSPRSRKASLPLGSIASGGLLGLVATFGLRRLSSVKSSKKGERVVEKLSRLS
jgi:hypothetical protein